MSALSSNKKQKEEPLIEFDKTEIDKITTAWEEFVNQLCLSDKSKTHV